MSAALTAPAPGAAARAAAIEILALTELQQCRVNVPGTAPRDPLNMLG